MNTPVSIMHSLAGSPLQEGCVALEHPTRCWICAGEMVRAIPVERFGGANYTDQNKARNPGGAHVCESCIWAHAWNVPPGFPPPEEGKKGLNLRLFSHFHDARGYLALNKASKPAMLKWLREPKHGQWFAAIADTGQKHTLPWTPINPERARRGIVRFEERNVALPDDVGWRMVDDTIALLTLGVTKEEMIDGRYHVSSVQHSGPLLRAFDATYAYLRGSPWFDLCLWLSQRNEEMSDAIQADRRTERVAAKQAREGAARDASRVPRKRSKPAQALGSDAGPDESGGPPVIDGGADDHVDVPRSAPTSTEQLSLFGNAQLEHGD